MFDGENVTKLRENWTSGHVADSSHVVWRQKLAEVADSVSVIRWVQAGAVWPC